MSYNPFEWDDNFPFLRLFILIDMSLFGIRIEKNTNKSMFGLTVLEIV